MPYPNNSQWYKMYRMTQMTPDGPKTTTENGDISTKAAAIYARSGRYQGHNPLWFMWKRRPEPPKESM